MSWKSEISIMVRTLINDLTDTPVYSDDRIEQIVVVAARYAIQEINFISKYTIGIDNISIKPDPTTATSAENTVFIGFVALKAACLCDQSTFRTKAINEGIKTSLGSASLQVAGNLAGYKTILDEGPCAMYQQLKMEYNIGNATAVASVLSPFVGNNFDPRSQLRGSFRTDHINHYS
jgi:hypothetical protein